MTKPVLSARGIDSDFSSLFSVSTITSAKAQEDKAIRAPSVSPETLLLLPQRPSRV